MKIAVTILICSVLFIACAESTTGTQPNVEKINLSNYQTAYFAAGCFWCVEAIFESVDGVVEVESGYAGGTIENPTYSLVSAGKTEHAEAVRVYYDSSIVSFNTLVEVFFNSHDPTTLNRQGPDRGAQYRSIAFFQTKREQIIVKSMIKKLLADESFSIITTEVKYLEKFYLAEAYHQDYEKNHPDNPYVQRVSIPRLEAFKRKMPEILKGH